MWMQLRGKNYLAYYLASAFSQCGSTAMNYGVQIMPLDASQIANANQTAIRLYLLAEEGFAPSQATSHNLKMSHTCSSSLDMAR